MPVDLEKLMKTKDEKNSSEDDPDIYMKTKELIEYSRVDRYLLENKEFTSV